LKFVPADTNNGDEVQYYFHITITAMVDIVPGYRQGLKLDSGACQPSLQVVAADRSLEFEEVVN
jgi:hypothetical protein